MPAAAADYFKLAGRDRLTTTLASDKALAAASMTAASFANWPTTTGVVAYVYTTDANNAVDTTTLVGYEGTISGSVFTIGSVVYGTDQLHSAGAKVTMFFGAPQWDDMITGVLVEHEQDGTHDPALVGMLAGAQTFTGVKTFNAIKFNPPQGYMINGKIETSVANNDLTVAIKTLAGSNPSATDPVYVRIGNTVRSITSALSVTKNDGTNWFNSGATGLATNEVDYFVYLGYNATDGVTLGFSRIPYARVYGDFSTTTTNDKYCAISTITTASNTDEYEVVGRFNAILSATASFNWSLPATSIIINRPVFVTRQLTYTPTYANTTLGSGTITGSYQIVDRRLEFRSGFTLGAGSSISSTVTITSPMTMPTLVSNWPVGTCIFLDAGVNTYMGTIGWTSTTSFLPTVGAAGGTYTTLSAINNTVPVAAGSGDGIYVDVEVDLA